MTNPGEYKYVRANTFLTMLNEHEVKFVDPRFTDITKGKEQHVTIPAHQVNAEFLKKAVV